MVACEKAYTRLSLLLFFNAFLDVDVVPLFADLHVVCSRPALGLGVAGTLHVYLKMYGSTAFGQPAPKVVVVQKQRSQRTIRGKRRKSLKCLQNLIHCVSSRAPMPTVVVRWQLHMHCINQVTPDR